MVPVAAMGSKRLGEQENIFIFCGTPRFPSFMMLSVLEASIIQGRIIGQAEIEQVRAIIAEHGQWSRRRISEHLAGLWEWRSASGQLKDMAARTLLLKLEDRGWIALPARRRIPSNRMKRKATMPEEATGELFAGQESAKIRSALADLLPLSIEEISRKKHAGKQAEFSRLLEQHHYLSHRGTVGENMQYLVSDRAGNALACVLFGAAAWQCKARDQEIGWDGATRARGLSSVTNNTRFLILPWVSVPHLASHVLGRIVRRLSADWQAKYAHPIHLLETFVDTSRFAGTCYRAANWRMAGMTTGRTRQNKTQIPQAAPKAVWLYPLRKDFREVLCAS
jgi:hypothetical protein